jgi:hypothetical protein
MTSRIVKSPELTAQRRLAAGTYVLRAVRGSREQRVVAMVRRV